MVGEWASMEGPSCSSVGPGMKTYFIKPLSFTLSNLRVCGQSLKCEHSDISF